ncbi:MAG: C25 family cysteine peptidase [Bacteroidota bacterium]
MKKLAGLLFFFITAAAMGQSGPYGNEWINPNQYYFKLSIYEEGIYRLGFNQLNAAGVLTYNPNLDPRQLQLFCKGIEQPLYVYDLNHNNIFESNDFVEFYANHNDGWFDAEVYDVPQSQTNSNYSLYNDTATCFLTWNTSLTNKRFSQFSNTNFSAHTQLSYFTSTSLVNYTSNYFYGETGQYNMIDPEFTATEGWFDDLFGIGSGSVSQTIYKSIPTYNINPIGTAEVEFAFVSASNYANVVDDHHIRVQFAGETIDTIFEGYKQIKINKIVSPSLLFSGLSTFTFSVINDLGAAVDYNSVSYIKVKYPRAFNLNSSNSFYLTLPATAEDTNFVEISGIGASATDSVFIYDLSGKHHIQMIRNGSNWRALIPGGTTVRNLYLTTGDNINANSVLSPINYNTLNPGKFNDFTSAAVKASNYLIVTHSSLKDEAEQYEFYRESSLGGSYNVLLADVDELYDQFGYGIRKHPLSIRKFCKYATEQFDSIPKDIFLIGKSYKPEVFRKNPTYYAGTLVPSYGNPPSDILFTNKLDDVLFKPAIPTGRLSAKIPYDVWLYLDKVKKYENAQLTPEAWMKEVLHFGGGTSEAEQDVLEALLQIFEDTVRAPYFGGNVTTFLKSSTEPIQTNTSDSLQAMINNGVAIMTFFGHAAGYGFDQSTNDPELYENYNGKYPFILANSCYAGDLFEIDKSSSEHFVIIENKGAIAYLSSISQSLISDLFFYSSNLYDEFSHIHYGKSLGEQIKHTIKTVQTLYPSKKDVCLGMTLHGDPAIKIHNFIKPDYTLSASDVIFDPPFISTERDSFNILVNAHNIGRAINDLYMLTIRRTFPDGTTEMVSKMVNAPLNTTQYFVSFAVNQIRGVGYNSFTITLDAFNNIDELNESNNSVTVGTYIMTADIYPVYPYQYAVIPSSTITLKASTGNPFAAMRSYVFQIDTTDTFNSPFLQSTLISHSGGVVEWTPPFSFTDSTVYYWRVSPDSATGGGYYNWKESSFQYVPTKWGWGQAHFFQFKNDDYTYVKFNRSMRRFDFFNDIKSILMQTGIYPISIQWQEEWMKMNGSLIGLWHCAQDVGNGIRFAVINPVSCQLWNNNVPPDQMIGMYNDAHCTPYSTGIYWFDFFTIQEPSSSLYGSITTSDWHNRIKHFLDTIPTGYYVLAYSHRNINADNFDLNLRNAFASVGSIFIPDISTVKNDKPYLLFGRKGYPGQAHEVLGNTSADVISLNDSITTNWKKGNIVSEIVGPATKWNSLHWKRFSNDPVNVDTIKLSVIGIKQNGSMDTLIHELPVDSGDIYNLYNRIDAQIYTTLKLVAEMTDDSLRTPSQMKRWQVLFEGVPETALDPSLHFTYHNDTLFEGDKVRLSIATHNISTYDMDSLRIIYYVIDASKNTHIVADHRLRPHPAGDILIDSISFSSQYYVGANILWIEVNPFNDQLEQYHFNNIGQLPFFVINDKINPILDVTFDGQHILDGDIVSAKPLIEIRMKDENIFLGPTKDSDTTQFRIYLQAPGESAAHRVYFNIQNNGILEFFPATLPENLCKVEWNALFPVDGTYQLLVQSKDVSQNFSGDYEYKISFEVINKSMITNVLNWPNPFTTRTHFVFTLTGSELPSYFKIQIFTITGKVVREIGLDELGSIRIGRNITDYTWDGTDQWGDRLANGIYLYRVVTNINGQNIERMSTGADQYFTKEFGKMYLMR